jgi:hypothetical protein
VGDSGLLVDPGLAWMVDYEEAVRVGMAITVPLTGSAAPARDGLATLLVVGVHTADPVEAAAALDRLLDVHARTDGLAFVPQGTPTNNTETVAAGWSAQELALADLAARELGDPAPVAHDNAARLAGALGLATSTTLRRAAFGTDPERERSRAMVSALFEAVMGTFVRRLLKLGDRDGLTPAAANALRDWCTHWVTGGAPLPTIAVGPQPYGVLPVRRSSPAASPSTTAERVEWMVGLLVDEWRRAAATVPVLDPDLVEQLPEGEQETSIATILATQPHPARLFTRWVDQYSSIAGTLGARPPHRAGISCSCSASTPRPTRPSARPWPRSPPSTRPRSSTAARPRSASRSRSGRGSATCCPSTSTTPTWSPRARAPSARW